MKRQNKKRNSILLFEMLVRHISKCLIDDKQQEAIKTLAISKKFFAEGTPLRNELNLFKSVLSSKSVSRDAMTKIIEYACKSAGLMNPRLIDEEKSKLIKEINYNLDDKVYNYKIPKYMDCSSLQMLFNDRRNKNKKLDEVFKIKVKDALITRLMESKELSTTTTVNPKYNNTVYKMLVSKFHEKYSSSLTENQKKFLIQYTANLMSEDSKVFNEFIKKENVRIIRSLKEIKDPKVIKDKELMIKIKECSEKYQKDLLVESLNDEKFVLGFLQYIALADEISK